LVGKQVLHITGDRVVVVTEVTGQDFLVLDDGVEDMVMGANGTILS